MKNQLITQEHSKVIEYTITAGTVTVAVIMALTVVMGHFSNILIAIAI